MLYLSEWKQGFATNLFLSEWKQGFATNLFLSESWTIALQS
jgi:hypothetical protein